MNRRDFTSTPAHVVEQLRDRALHDPILQAALIVVDRGDMTAENVLALVALHYSEERELLTKAYADALAAQPFPSTVPLVSVNADGETVPSWSKDEFYADLKPVSEPSS